MSGFGRPMSVCPYLYPIYGQEIDVPVTNYGQVDDVPVTDHATPGALGR